MSDPLDALLRPDAWPGGADRVDVVETHISRVFLVGDRAYKVKKAVDFGFVDYSTLDKRRHWCEAEVRLNRRFAPDVYRGVVPIDASGKVGGPGTPIEWAIEMVRLHDGDTLRSRLGTLTVDEGGRIGRTLGALHAALPTSEAARRFATPDAVAANALENFTQTRDQVGDLVNPAVHARVEALTTDALERLRPAIAARVPLARDGHGDLRAEHVYLLDDGRLEVLDCVEFAPRYRCGDPMADLGFLAMDLAVYDRRDLADAVTDGWLTATDDADGRALLPFYAAYRSVVRAKVRGLQGDRDRARRHWLWALATLAPPGDRPCLVGIGGLPGTGKSTVSHGLAERAGFAVIRSDVVRKELVGLDPLARAGEHGWETGLYDPGHKDRTYAECLRRATEIVEAGGRAIVDASFSRDRWRTDLLDTAAQLGVPARLLWCEAPPEVVRPRLDARGADPSDADWSVYAVARDRWETEGPRTLGALGRVDTSRGRDDAIARGLVALGPELWSG